MNNLSIEFDSARAILTTYQQIRDNSGKEPVARSKKHQKNKALESELQKLKEQYLLLQNELINRDKKLLHLNRELSDKTSAMIQLQEDFENAIYQLTQKKIIP